MADDPEPPPPGDEPPPPDDVDAPGLQLIQGGGRGAVIEGVNASFHGVVTLLEEVDNRARVLDTEGPLEWDAMGLCVTLDREPIDLDQVVGQIRLNAARRLRVLVSKPTKGNVNAVREAALVLAKEPTTDALLHVAKANPFHPVRDYLDALHRHDWITSPIDYVGGTLLGLQSELDLQLLRRWAISAVARAMRPGCEVHTALILRGKPGVGKTGFFKAIVPPGLFVNSPMDLENRYADSILMLSKAWVYEWGELDSIKKASIERTNGMLTANSDTIRVPYGKSHMTHPRSSVIVGTTNERFLVNDEALARRFWVVEIAADVDLQTVTSVRDDFWAEARAEYEMGTAWHFDRSSTFQTDLAARTEDVTVHDAWEEPVAKWLESTTDPITVHEALTHSVRSHDSNYTTADEKRMQRVLKSLGYVFDKKVKVNGVTKRVWKLE